MAANAQWSGPLFNSICLFFDAMRYLMASALPLWVMSATLNALI